MYDQKTISQIEKEANIQNSLDSENIVKLIDFVREPKQIFLIEEFVDGFNLEALFEQIYGLNPYESVQPKQLYEFMKNRKEENPLYVYQSYVRNLFKPTYKNLQQDVSILLKRFNRTVHPITLENLIDTIFTQLLKTTSELHSHGILHRDLKLSNLLFTSDLELKLIDFGSARDDAMGSTITGTRGFMAPELTLSESNTQLNYNSKVDMYSLGCCLYFLFHGHSPQITKRNLLFELLQAESNLFLPIHKNVPDKYVYLLEHLLSKNPALRPGCDQAIQLLQTLNNPFKVAVSGAYQVGKSFLLKSLSGELEDRSLYYFSFQDNVFLLFDTQETENLTESLNPVLYKNADLCVLVFKDYETQQQTQRFQRLVAGQNPNCRFLTVYNKFGTDAILKADFTFTSNQNELKQLISQKIQQKVEQTAEKKKVIKRESIQILVDKQNSIVKDKIVVKENHHKQKMGKGCCE